MYQNKPETTHSGIKIEGDWEEICGFARDLEDILKDSYEKDDSAEDMDDSIEDYNEWRPREEEDEKDISKKTVEEASINEKKVEKEFKGTDEELKSAGKKFKEGINGAANKGKSAAAELKDASKNIVNGKSKISSKDPDSIDDIAESVDKKTAERKEKEKSATKELKDASKCINRLVGAKSIESLRKMEKAIYEQIMLKFNPYYFDTEHFSVNLEEKNNDHYLLTVNIPDDQLRETIKDGLEKEDR
ncbi:MAG: hypothetical protein KGY68_03575 [Candidatus Thermoplasmatota archaeon]|nr:hypothetical protein [Candidatus Thermoplasmatota archaeon]